MGQGSRPDRVGEEIRQELATQLSRHVHDPGIGFVTLTRVKVSPDLQLARVFYTMLGDETKRRETERALVRATPFLRRQIGAKIRLRRVPELRFEFDQSVENQDRIERILLEIKSERDERDAPEPVDAPPEPQDPAAAADSNDLPDSRDPKNPQTPRKSR
jgi:ribosome-binding factor A